MTEHENRDLWSNLQVNHRAKGRHLLKLAAELEDQVDHGTAGGGRGPAQVLELLLKANDALIDAVLDDGELLADGANQVVAQLY